MARVKLSGDFAKKMDRWAELLKTSSVIVEHTSKAQAEVAVTLIGEGFDNESDPYGRKWEPKKVDDNRKVLHGETTRLRNGWHVVKADKGGFRVAPSVEYAGYHQEPRSGSRPTRMQVPSREKGLPKAWSEEFEAAAQDEASRHFGGKKPRLKGPVKTSPGGADRSASTGNAPSARKAKKNRGGIRSLGGLIRRIKEIRALAKKVGVE